MNLDDFVTPDMSDVGFRPEEYLSKAPASATMKGVLFNDLAKMVGREQLGPSARPRYIAFKEYPLREWMEVLLYASRQAFPRQPKREALHRMGLRAYEAFGTSRIGKVMFAMAGRDLKTLYGMSPRIIGVANSAPTLETETLDESRMIIRVRNTWDFPDCYTVGIWEGPARSFGQDCRVKVCSYSICDIDYLLDFS